MRRPVDVADGAGQSALGYIPRTVNRVHHSACAALVIAAALAGCGAGTHKRAAKGTVNATKLEAAIADSAQAQRHQHATVICPAGLPDTGGQHFYCAAQSGQSVTPFLVKVGAGGKLSYAGVSAARTAMLSMGKLELAIKDALLAKHRAPRSVACPAQMPRQQGLEFVCAATLDSMHTVSFIVRELNSIGRVSFNTR
jgi:hypothetical protein